LPDGPLIVVANEFVDALPVDQIVKTETGWHERKIGLVNDKLAFALDPTPLPQIEESLPERLRGAPVGSMLESRNLSLFHELAKSIGTHGGAALLIDYGHTKTDFGDTLQAVRAHLPVDPLEHPGEADLTAHVSFEQLAIAGMMSGVHALGPVNQGDFLRALGIEMRAERLRRDQSDDVAMAIDTALARLIDPSPGMGELFKVLAYAHPSLPTPPGFDT
jgi:SAM-dependent MidA family methyltransferase